MVLSCRVPDLRVNPGGPTSNHQIQIVHPSTSVYQITFRRAHHFYNMRTCNNQRMANDSIILGRLAFIFHIWISYQHASCTGLHSNVFITSYKYQHDSINLPYYMKLNVWQFQCFMLATTPFYGSSKFLCMAVPTCFFMLAQSSDSFYVHYLQLHHWIGGPCLTEFLYSYTAFNIGDLLFLFHCSDGSFSLSLLNIVSMTSTTIGKGNSQKKKKKIQRKKKKEKKKNNDFYKEKKIAKKQRGKI